MKYYLARVIEKLACWFADALIVATLYEKEYFFRYKSKVFVIPNFVNTKLFFKKFYSRTSSGEKNILYIGRLTAQKNLENFLHALIGVDGVRFRIIGSGELQATLMDIVKQNNLPVEFLGNIPYLELPEYIHEADIFVLPSFYEGNPKVLLEAMGCGAAVLATKVSGIKEIVIHEKNGYLSDTNVESLHHALLAFLPNVQLQKFVGENAQQLIEKEYSIESVIEKELAVYRTLHIDI